MICKYKVEGSPTPAVSLEVWFIMPGSSAYNSTNLIDIGLDQTQWRC